MVAALTRTRRSLVSGLDLTAARDGVPTDCVVNFDNVHTLTGKDMAEMPLELAPRIVVDPAVRFGKPVIKGTRVPVELIIAKLAGGMTAEEVAEEYGLVAEDIRVARSYAGRI